MYVVGSDCRCGITGAWPSQSVCCMRAGSCQPLLAFSLALRQLLASCRTKVASPPHHSPPQLDLCLAFSNGACDGQQTMTIKIHLAPLRSRTVLSNRAYKPTVDSSPHVSRPQRTTWLHHRTAATLDPQPHHHHRSHYRRTSSAWQPTPRPSHHIQPPPTTATPPTTPSLPAPAPKRCASCTPSHALTGECRVRSAPFASLRVV